jgi:hypothetical protein
MPGYVTKVQFALAGRPDEKLRADQVAKLAGITVRTFNRHAWRLVGDGHISRTKPHGSNYYRYFLSAEQLDAYNGLTERLVMVTDSDDIPGRLGFLRMLKERTVYSEHAALKLIIQDYERTLKLRRAIENRKGE